MVGRSRPPIAALSIAGAVLAGGQSTRMGTPKEGVRLRDGRTMMEAVLAAVGGCCPSVAVVGTCSGFDCSGRPGLMRLRDEHPGLGPLAGMEALLASGLARGYLVAACDQPLLTASLLARLLDGPPGSAHFFKDERTGEELDPLPGYFTEGWLPAVRAALEEGRRSFRGLVRALPAAWVAVSGEERALLASVDTPEELAGLGARGGTP